MRRPLETGKSGGVAEEEGESLNLFFETLARCEAQLKGVEPAARNDFEGPSP